VARWRAAEALLARRGDRNQAGELLAAGSSRPHAEQALRNAHQTAVALDAAPLRRQIESLAKRDRLRLDDPSTRRPGRRHLPQPHPSA
jgi:hypothetical protein